jgi:two-component system chemotaxis response regulator CheB
MTKMPTRKEAIVIGGSAGALDALQTILPSLPRAYALPIVVVLHMLPGRPSGLAGVLGASTALPVKEAEDKEPIRAGMVYLASPSYHLLVEKDRCFALSVDEPVHFSRPSIDVLFESAADAFGKGLVGVLLSGANEDGARGLLGIRRAGGFTIVQSPETAASRQMPESALRLEAADRVSNLATIGELLRAIAGLPVPLGGTIEKVSG